MSRFAVLETWGWLEAEPCGRTVTKHKRPPNVSAHVYDQVADRVIAVYRSEDVHTGGRGCGLKHASATTLQRAHELADRLNAGLA